MPEPRGYRGRLHRPVPLTGLTALLFAAAACNSPRPPVPVSGTVTLDGKPVEGATVTFHLIGDDKEGRPATGQTDKAGAFRLKTGNEDGARPGEYKVVAWHERARPSRHTVRIEPGRATTVTFDIPLSEDGPGD